MILPVSHEESGNNEFAKMARVDTELSVDTDLKVPKSDVC